MDTTAISLPRDLLVLHCVRVWPMPVESGWSGALFKWLDLLYCFNCPGLYQYNKGHYVACIGNAQGT